ncbi:MAG TPA: hypothetical protein GX507_07905 [Clostridia bacterium]|nr:hypothetical protein [Clostridia bacterium]
MILRVLLGRAGTGRTRRCIEEILHHEQHQRLGPPLLLIVPDQATFTMEREPALKGGTLRTRVYGFRRLAYQVLQEVGGLDRIPVSELGRRMMLKHILMDEHERLPLLQALHNRPGFLGTLSSLMAELKMHHIDPAGLEDLADALSGHSRDGRLRGNRLLALKLREVSLVYRCLEERLSSRMIDPDGYLDLLAERLPKAGFLKGCRVWMDGFATFTPQEFEVLKALSSLAEEMTVTLCLDPELRERRPPEYSPFIKPYKTRLRLIDLARTIGADYRELCLKPDETWRLAEAPEIAHLEAHFFDYPTVPYTGEVRRVHILSAVNPRAEVYGIVRTIRRLLREGVRARHIMVAVRNVDLYFPLLRRALHEYEIPFFLDHRQPIAHHPLIELLRSALEVGRTNWSYEAVFRYLKTGLTSVHMDHIDELENYVLAAGIRGRRWYDEDPWMYRPGHVWTSEFDDDEERPAGGLLNQNVEEWDLDKINEIRKVAVAALRRMWERVKALSNTPFPHRLKGRDWARILLDLFLDLRVPWRLDAWSQSASDAGMPDLAREHRQVWRLVSGVLDEFVEVLGEVELMEEDVTAVLDTAWEALRLSLIPPRLDAVTVGSLERSRPPRDIKALFIPGLNDGVLPGIPRTYGVLTETEREELSRLADQRGYDLPVTIGDRLQSEQFLIYRSLTLTGGDLWLSYPLGDGEGRALTPAATVRRVGELLPGIKTEFLPQDPGAGFTEDGTCTVVEHPSDVLPHLPGRCREAMVGQKVNPVWWHLYDILESHPVWRIRLEKSLAGLRTHNQEKPLGVPLSLEIWGSRTDSPTGSEQIVEGSVSRLEMFAACPFALFASAGLRLRERTEYGLTPPDTGQFYHEALRRFVTRVNSQGFSWESLDDERIETYVSEITEELACRLQGRILLSNARLRHQKEYLRERISHSVRAAVRQVRMGKFRPIAVEVVFGKSMSRTISDGSFTTGTGVGDAEPVTENSVTPKRAFMAEDGLPVPFLDRALLPALKVRVEPVGGTPVLLQVRGRIDRIDMAVVQDSVYLRVIDYKTGDDDLDLSKILSGLQLQLPIYGWVAQRGLSPILSQYYPDKVTRSAGLFYFRIQRPMLKLETAMEGLPRSPSESQSESSPGVTIDLDREWLKAFRLTGLLVDYGPDFYGLFDSELDEGRSSSIVPLTLTTKGHIHGNSMRRSLNPSEWEVLRSALRLLLSRICRDIVSGRVDILPAQLEGGELPCKHCRYHPVCRFDPSLSENRPRIVSLSGKVLRERLKRAASREEEVVDLIVYNLDG